MKIGEKTVHEYIGC